MPSTLPEEVIVTPAVARLYRYVCMMMLYPLVDGTDTYLVYRALGSSTVLAQKYVDQDQWLLPEVEE